jgi:L-fuconolactonase
MKLDAHQHFWKYNAEEYGWISENMSILKNDFLPQHLSQELQNNGIDGSIVVQARQTLEETRWLLELANENDFIKGVVGWVDLCAPKVEQQLIEFLKNPKFIGVRHVIHDEPDDKFMARNDFLRGISLLQKYNLTYDILIFQKHLPLATTFVEKFPQQKFVLDHIAKPDMINKTNEAWAAEIKKLAGHSNVFCKLSGMVTEAKWEKWSTSDFKYYLDTVFDAFGFERLMIGSDWPVCTVAGKYNDVMRIVIDYIKIFDENIQRNILGENCRKFYLSIF